MQNDLDMLKKLLEDEQHIHDVSKTIIWKTILHFIYKF